jgi:hypothetical protein
MNQASPIADDEWSFHSLGAERGAALGVRLSFEEIAYAIAAGASVVDRKLEPYRTAASKDACTARQMIFRLRLSPRNLCDQFFNGRDGLRARYWQSEKDGENATQHLIAQLMPSLLEDAQQHFSNLVFPNVEPMSLKEIEHALNALSAKVWPMEGPLDNECLEVKRWRGNPHPRWGHMWTWTPETADIEIKSALLDTRGLEHVPEAKRDRSRQIHDHGFS